MELWQLVTSIVITLAGVFTAVKTLTKPIKDKLDELTSIEKRTAKLESWTEKQQIDLQDVSEKLSLTFNATLALLNHAIVMQNGNGKCHAAQDAMEKYIHNSLTKLNSYKDED